MHVVVVSWCMVWFERVLYHWLFVVGHLLGSSEVFTGLKWRLGIGGGERDGGVVVKHQYAV